MANRGFIPLALLLAASSLAGAQEILTLEQAVETARLRNAELSALRARAEAAALGVDVARRRARPRVGIDMAAQRTNTPAVAFAHRLNAGGLANEDLDVGRLNQPNALSYLGTALVIEVPIDVAGRVGLEAGAREASHSASMESIREAEASLRFQVVEAYSAALLARRAVDAREKALIAAQSRETVMNERVNEGVALQADLLRARARRRARAADLAGQKATQSTADAALARLLGLENPSDLALADLPSDPAPVAGLSVEEWIAKAEAQRPLLRSADERSRALSLTRRLEERTSWPEVFGQARLMDDRTSWSGGGQSWSVSMMLRWNLFDATRPKRVAVAAANERAAGDDARASRDQVRFEVRAAFNQLAAAREQFEAATGGAEEGREALRVIQERRARGVATLTDELEAEAEALSAALNEIEAERNVVLAAEGLRRAVSIDIRSNLP